MIDFIKQVFASAIGFIMVFVLFFFFLFILFVATSSDPEPKVSPNTVLFMKASGAIPERMSSDPFEQLFFGGSPGDFSVRSFEQNLRKAAADDNIKGILLEVDFVTASWPTLQQLRRAMLNFREDSGKFIYATTNDLGLNEQGFYLASAADSIFAPPMSIMQFDGFVLEGMFLKSMLDEIGVKAEVIHQGAYKSAGDMFQRTNFSAADREQLTAIFSHITDELEQAVAERTGMSRAEVTAMMNQPPRLDVEYYAERGLIDAIVFPSELENRIKARLGLGESDDLNRIASRRYDRVSDRSAGLERAPREAVAVIYANGAIMPGTDDPFPFGGEQGINVDNFKRSLDRALSDNNVKAIVVRINSPGGSAATSDAIWQLIQEAREQKPVVASMGAVAASGGYYIAMAAETIVADRTTITGSIGVIGIRFDASRLLEDRIKLDFDELRFHENANWFSPTRPLTGAQRDAFSFFIDDAYDKFLARVSESRGMSVEEIHEVAQGRVWSGEDARNIGLIDAVGGLDLAVQFAADKAGLEAWSIREFPREQSFIETLASRAEVSVRSVFSRNIPMYEEMSFIRHMAETSARPHAWAILPWQLEVK
ncbi:MAG: signal peptide peptidase SppA [Candidatus Cyclonatronum sp.]|uniref:signal peptide peptidase SppA n=1 Tax=Cyclonatronum sp. TaxID=3024185 RepID=UPI0025C50A57|nr:signal peptide peptidase SppA [Cyclonatronum sp.]MCH8487563.1 signal peptide peptidase SppA [Cyclonatronum sp.]